MATREAPVEHALGLKEGDKCAPHKAFISFFMFDLEINVFQLVDNNRENVVCYLLKIHIL